MTVRVHIERMVLEGFPLTAGESRRVKQSVQQELARLLTASGLASETSSGGAVPTAQGGAFRPPQGASAGEIGRHIAQSIHGGIGRAE